MTDTETSQIEKIAISSAKKAVIATAAPVVIPMLIVFCVCVTLFIGFFVVYNTIRGGINNADTALSVVQSCDDSVTIGATGALEVYNKSELGKCITTATQESIRNRANVDSL